MNEKRKMIECAIENAREKLGIENELKSLHRTDGESAYQIQIWLQGRTSPIAIDEGDFNQEWWDYEVAVAVRKEFGIAGVEPMPPPTRAGSMGGI